MTSDSSNPSVLQIQNALTEIKVGYSVPANEMHSTLRECDSTTNISAELYCTVFDTIHGLPVAAFQPELI